MIYLRQTAFTHSLEVASDGGMHEHALIMLFQAISATTSYPSQQMASMTDVGRTKSSEHLETSRGMILTISHVPKFGGGQDRKWFRSRTE